MAIPKHAHSDLINEVGREVVVKRFNLSPQALYNWRTRGIAPLKLVAFAKLLSEHGKVAPPDFFEKLAA